MSLGVKRVAGFLLVFVIGILVFGAGSVIRPGAVSISPPFNSALWEYRGFDLLAQAMLLIAGALAVIVILGEEPGHG